MALTSTTPISSIQAYFNAITKLCTFISIVTDETPPASYTVRFGDDTGEVLPDDAAELAVLQTIFASSAGFVDDNGDSVTVAINDAPPATTLDNLATYGYYNPLQTEADAEEVLRKRVRKSRELIGTGTHIGLNDPDDVVSSSAANWAVGIYSFDPVDLADVDGFSVTARFNGRSGKVVNLSREQVLYAQNYPSSSGWPFVAPSYNDNSLLPCVMLTGRHNSNGIERVEIKPERSQLGYVINAIESGADLTYALLMFFRYNADGDEITGIHVAAISDHDVEIETMHLHFWEAVSDA